MERDEYVKALSGLLSKDPDRIRDANRKLFSAAVGQTNGSNTQQDLALAEAAATN